MLVFAYTAELCNALDGTPVLSPIPYVSLNNFISFVLTLVPSVRHAA